MIENKGIFLYLSLTLWAQFFSQCEDICLSICLFWSRLWLIHVGQKKIFALHSHSNFFSKFQCFSRSFNLVSHANFRNLKILEIGSKLRFLAMFFPSNYFLCGRVPSFLENSYKNVNWLWIDCEKISIVILFFLAEWG